MEDETVEVSVERPVDLGFDSALCSVPSFEWTMSRASPRRRWRRRTTDGLTNATNFVMLSHAEICERWREYFHGDTTFYK